MKTPLLRYLSLGGIFGPLLFITLTISMAFLRPEYRHFTHFISELGATGTSNAKWMNYLGFIPSGIMIAGFGIALVGLLPAGNLGKVGAICITLFGIGMLAAGLYSCDVGCPRNGSWENNIHDQVSGPAFIFGILGMLLLGFAFRKLEAWRGLWIYSVVSALLAIGFLIGLISSLEAYQTTGTWQRLLIITIFLWCIMVGRKLFKSDTEKIMI